MPGREEGKPGREFPGEVPGTGRKGEGRRNFGLLPELGTIYPPFFEIICKQLHNMIETKKTGKKKNSPKMQD